jgi:MYXO-CTERM domain-containing protein
MDAGIFGGANMLLLLLALAGFWLSRRRGTGDLPRLLPVNEEEAVAQ